MWCGGNFDEEITIIFWNYTKLDAIFVIQFVEFLAVFSNVLAAKKQTLCWIATQKLVRVGFESLQERVFFLDIFFLLQKKHSGSLKRNAGTC